MFIEYFPGNTISELEGQLSDIGTQTNVKGVMLLTCDANMYRDEDIDEVLRSFSKPIYGGVFPALIFNRNKYDKGFIIITSDREPDINLIENISNAATDLDIEVAKRSDHVADVKTMFVFIDGFALRINEFIESVFSVYGLEYNFIGGGAGSLSLQQKPCIISNQGLKQDAAIMVGLKMSSGIGVEHGWEKIAGPFQVTSAEKTIIKELDFKPAFEIYKDVVENKEKTLLNAVNFFEIAKGYPFGINKIDAETVVRDPVAIVNNTELLCVGEVDAGVFVEILNGNKESLIKAAGRAVNTALSEKENLPENFLFFIDCISRVLFLEEDFNQELTEVFSIYNKVPMVGALTIGEIANNGKNYLEFYNKTSVVACF